MKKIIIFYLGILLVLQLAAQSKTITIHGIVNDSTVKSIEISHTVTLFSLKNCQHYKAQEYRQWVN
ncbi:hypothetical protein [Niabella aquatica]